MVLEGDSRLDTPQSYERFSSARRCGISADSRCGPTGGDPAPSKARTALSCQPARGCQARHDDERDYSSGVVIGLRCGLPEHRRNRVHRDDRNLSTPPGAQSGRFSRSAEATDGTLTELGACVHYFAAVPSSLVSCRRYPEVGGRFSKAARPRGDTRQRCGFAAVQRLQDQLPAHARDSAPGSRSRQSIPSCSSTA